MRLLLSGSSLAASISVNARSSGNSFFSAGEAVFANLSRYSRAKSP